MYVGEYFGKTGLRSLISPRFSRRAFVIFLTGFLAGLALVFIGQEGLVQNTSFLNHESIEGISALEIDRQGLLLYSLRQRLLPAGVMVLAAAAGAGGAAVCLFLLWSGFSAGALLSVLSLRYGIRGVVLFAGGVLPQAFLLVPAFWLLCGWCVTFGQKRGGKAGAGKALFLTAEGRLLFLIFCAFIGGCVLEGYVNPSALDKIFLLFRM